MSLSRRQLLLGSGLAAAGLALTRGRGAAAPARPAIRLTANENPYGPSDGARRAIVRAAGDANRYVRLDDAVALRAAIGARLDVPPDHVLLAPGSQAILDLAALACARGGRVVAADPSYGGFIRHAGKLGELDLVPLDGKLAHDLDEMERRVTAATRVVYVCNPNNPTGTIVPGKRLRAFCEAVSRRATVLVDEAYAELVDDPAYASMIDLARAGADVIVARTFSKAYGLAGMRVGYAVAHPSVLARLADIRSAGDMWLPALGVRAALASVGDEAFLASTRRRISAARGDTIRALRGLGLEPAESHANFVYFRVPGRFDPLRAALESRGVLVGGRADPRDGMRVTVGTADEMQAFIAAMRESLAAI